MHTRSERYAESFPTARAISVSLKNDSCWIPGSWMCRGRTTPLLSPLPPGSPSFSVDTHGLTPVALAKDGIHPHLYRCGPLPYFDSVPKLWEPHICLMVAVSWGATGSPVHPGTVAFRSPSCDCYEGRSQRQRGV